MRDLSVKGVARLFLGQDDEFNVRSTYSLNPGPGAEVSLRDRMEDLAEREYSFDVDECVYGWTAAFRQTWTHIVVRINTNPDSGISTATESTLQATWQTGIETTWNNQWAASRSGELSCRISFDVIFSNSNPHHNVRIRTGPARSNMSTFDTQDTGAVAAHEFGHMLGHPDEYSDPACPNRSPVNTGTVMDNNSNNVPNRLMTRFANNIGSSVVSP